MAATSVSSTNRRPRKQYTIPASTLTSTSTFHPLDVVPLVSLRALLDSDASHREIVRRLRLNLAIRLLLEAEAAADCAGVQ